MDNVKVRPLREADIATLEEVLTEHVRDLHTGEIVESEVKSILSYMLGAADEVGRIRHYLVATSRNGEPVGCMAISTPDAQMANHFKDDAIEAVELLNAFVRTEYLRGNGIGSKLFQAACDYGRENGARNLIVNSGPRYFNSWGFYDRVCDREHGIINNKYGEGRHAKTWIKRLS